MPRPKKSFSPEFKEEAVKMVIETSKLTPQARGQLDEIRRRQEDLQRVENFAKYAVPNTDADDEQPRT